MNIVAIVQARMGYQLDLFGKQQQVCFSCGCRPVERAVVVG